MRSFAFGLTGAASVVLGIYYLLASALALVGRAAGPDALETAVLVVVVEAAVLTFVVDDDSWRKGVVPGIAIGLTLVAGLELIGSNSISTAGLVGGVAGALAAFPILGVAHSGVTARRVLHVALVVLVVVVGVSLVRTIIGSGALGHDESAYVLKTRAWLKGTPSTGWGLHRAPLVSLLAIPVVAFTESEVAIRSLAVLMSIGALCGVMLAARRLGGWWVALIAGATVGTSLAYLRWGAEYLTDAPSAGVLLLIVGLVLGVVAAPETARHRVYWLGLLIPLAFYLRYQSALSIAGVALATAIVWPATVKRLGRPILLTAGVAFFALLPHFIWATVVTGRPWGIVTLTGEGSGREFIGEGLVDYVHMFPYQLVGPVGAVLMGLGIVWIAWALATGWRRRTDEARLAGFVAIVVLVAVVPLGLVAHGEPRFVFFPAWLLVAAGARAIVQVVTLLSARQRIALVAAAALVWAPLFLETERRADRNAEARGENLAVLVEAANIMHDESSGSCGVLTGYLPQVTWYSTCSTRSFRPSSPDLGVGGLQGDSDFALFFEAGKRQPADEEQHAYLELGPTLTVPAQSGSLGDATIVFVNGG